MFKHQQLRLFFCFLFLLLSFWCGAQTTSVRGKVTDEKGLGIPGVSILLKGTSTGTVSEANGGYTIAVTKPSDVLVFSSIGFVTQEITVANNSVLDILLKEDFKQLSEVVVVGYGTQKRKDVTGSVASIKGEAFKDQPITNVTEALQGRTPGVEIIKGSGAPDATPTVIIRGLASLNQPAPLYIIDGVRVPNDNNINVQDIASIDVLKDASAASIYGSAAAGGVIVITTKKGSGATPTVNFNARYGITKPRLVKLLNKNDYIALQNILNPQYFKNATLTDTLADTDWVKTLYGNAYEKNYNLSISGSTPVVTYLVSGFYNDQKGIYIKNYSNIGGARVNTDYTLGKRVKFGEQLAISQRKTAPPVGTEAQLHNAPFRTLPIIPIRGKDGKYGVVPAGYNGLTFGGPNPYGAAELANAENFKNNLQANVYAEVKLPLNLSFRTNFGYSYYHENQDYFQNSFDFGPVKNPFNSLNKMTFESRQILSNYVLTFDRSLGNHNVNALVGYEQISNRSNSLNVTASLVGLPNYSVVPTTETKYVVSGVNDQNGLIKSKFARINYNFSSRYYLSASIREDANFIVFGPGKQKGIFPAASVGWNISDENFFKPATGVVSNLKLRASYGALGNSNIAPYSFVASYGQFQAFDQGSAGGQNFAPGGGLVLANTISAIPNPNIHWETVYETNIGIDGDLFNSKLYFTAEWYNKETKDMLYALPLALSSGITRPYLTNIGSVSSRGMDVLVGYRSKVGDLGYDVSLTGGFNKNKVISLSGITTDALYDGYNYYNNGDAGFNIMANQPITVTKAGLPFGSFYGYKVLGLFQTDVDADNSAQPNALAGDLIFEDVNNDKKIDDKDKQVIGNANPKLVFGTSIRLNWKGFDAAFLFNGVAGVDLFNGVKAYEMYPFADGNTTNKVFGASFLGTNGLTSQPRLGVVNTDGSFTLDPNKNYTSVNSYFIEKGDYIKLKNLQLGYTFSDGLLSKIKAKRARIFVMANNLLTITKYSGLDPELSGAFSQAGYGAVTTRGLDAVSKYPQTRIYSLGIDLTF